MSKLLQIFTKPTLILLIIVALGSFLRFYKLSYFPIHLNHDEVTQLYDAISIARTGKDIYGNKLPFIFPSVNDFKELPSVDELKKLPLSVPATWISGLSP